jgi:mycothiol synthase
MLDVTVRRPIAPDDIDAVRALAAAAEAADHRPPFGDSVWRDLAHPTPSSMLVIAESDGRPVGTLHLAPPENRGETGLIAAIVVEPRHRGGEVEHALAEAALGDETVAGSRILVWVFGADGTAERFMAASGFRRERELHQMRAELPIAVGPDWPEGVDVRPFRPGVDEETWLAVNNRAFADDPDQRGWTLDTLRRREEEACFDPAGFLLAWRDDALAGFCWTRLHPAAPPHEPDALGEIYVIGVDPDHQGIGLGRALVAGGLGSLHDRGARVGMLFVDTANTAAIRLYEKLGFVATRVDRAYVRDPR